MSFVNKIFQWLKTQDWAYRFQQLIVLILHLILLRWMLYTLSEAGQMTVEKVLLHFTGMAIFGALLIRGTALWAKWRYERELRENQKHEQSHKQNSKKRDVES